MKFRSPRLVNDVSGVRLPYAVSYWFIGVYISSNAHKLEAALIGTDSSSDGSTVELRKSVSFDLPYEYSRAFSDFKFLVHDKNCLGKDSSSEKSVNNRRDGITFSYQCGEKGGNLPSETGLALLADLRNMTAVLQEEAVVDLLNKTDITAERIVAIVLNTPAVWKTSESDKSQGIAFGLNDGLVLAQKTGINVVDLQGTFDFTHVRQNIMLLPYWILLDNGENKNNKVLIDLGNSARWFFIPSSSRMGGESWKKLQFKKIGPCGAFLDCITNRITKGKNCVDVGGKLSVQGRCINELLMQWNRISNSIVLKGNSSFVASCDGSSCCLSEWGLDDRDENIYLESLLKVLPDVVSVDTLCTASQWIVEQIVTSIETYKISFGQEPFDIVLAGAVKRNGLLLNKLTTALSPRPVYHLSDLFLGSEDSFDSVATALLGLFTVLGKPVLCQKDGKIMKETLGNLFCASPKTWNLLTSFQVFC